MGEAPGVSLLFQFHNSSPLPAPPALGPAAEPGRGSTSWRGHGRSRPPLTSASGSGRRSPLLAEMRGHCPPVFPRGGRLPGSCSQRPPSSLVWLYPEGKGSGAAAGALCHVLCRDGCGSWERRAERWECCWQARADAPEIGRSAGCLAGKVLARPVVGIGRRGGSVQLQQVKVQPG